MMPPHKRKAANDQPPWNWVLSPRLLAAFAGVVLACAIANDRFEFLWLKSPNDGAVHRWGRTCIYIWSLLCIAAGLWCVACKRPPPRDAAIWPIALPPVLVGLLQAVSMVWEITAARGTPALRFTRSLPIDSLDLLLVLTPFGIGALTGVVLYAGAWSWRRQGRPKAGMCAKCGYNLFGNTSGICPECGRPLT